MKVFAKNHFSKRKQIHRKLNFVVFTKDVLNEKSHFLCIEICGLTDKNYKTTVTFTKIAY